MPKFRLSRRQFLNRLGYFLQHSAVANTITAVDISPLILKGLAKELNLCLLSSKHLFSGYTLSIPLNRAPWV